MRKIETFTSQILFVNLIIIQSDIKIWNRILVSRITSIHDGLQPVASGLCISSLLLDYQD